MPLTPATLVGRYKRFLSDHRLEDGSVVTAHCANPGAMTGIADPGMATWLREAAGRGRKLAWSWELVRAGGTLVGCHTGRPNEIVAEAIAGGAVAPLAGYRNIRREVPYGERSRVDFLLQDAALPDCYVEVKNCHLVRRKRLAEFPDAVTRRGRRHMEELADVAEGGARAVVIWCVQRADCEAFTVADDIDPGFGEALREAAGRGVETFAYSCRLTLEGIALDRQLPIRLA